MLGGGSVADPPDDPVLVEAVPEFAQCAVELCGRAEAPQPEQLLLRGADEALDAPVALGLADEGRARLDAEGLELVLEGVGDELGAMVAAKARALGDADLVVAPGGPDRLAQALDGLESRAPQRGTDAQALAGAVVDEDEDGGVSLVGEAPFGVDGPHPVGPVGDMVRSWTWGPRTATERWWAPALRRWTVARESFHVLQTRWMP